MQTEQKQLLSSTENSERDRIVDTVRRFGTSMSDAVLDPVCKIFTLRGLEGLIGYRIESSYAIVYGDPVCDPSLWQSFVPAFHHYCQEQNLRIIYLAATEHFSKWAVDHLSVALVEFGEELVLDPRSDPKTQHGENGHVIRRKVKHALKEGFTVSEYLSGDEELENAIDQVGAAWLQSRHGPQIHVAHVHLFKDPLGKRWFYASQGEAIIGVVQISRMKAQNGWLLSHLMHRPEEPQGIPELLIISVLETLAREDCPFISFGAVTTNELGKITGLGQVSSWLARKVFNTVTSLFHLGARKKFWAKFNPQNEPLYIMFSHPRIGFGEVSALMRALNVHLFNKK